MIGMQMKTLNVMVDENTNIFRFCGQYYIFQDVGESQPIPADDVAARYFEARLRVPEAFTEIRQIFSVFM